MPTIDLTDAKLAAHAPPEAIHAPTRIAAPSGRNRNQTPGQQGAENARHL